MKALKTRWWEEEQLLLTEMRRTVRFYNYHKWDWEKKAIKYDCDGKAGHAAYSRKYVK